MRGLIRGAVVVATVIGAAAYGAALLLVNRGADVPVEGWVALVIAVVVGALAAMIWAEEVMNR